MYAQVEKIKENKSQSVVNAVFQKKSSAESTFQFVDNRPQAIAQRQLQEKVKTNQEKKRTSVNYHSTSPSTPVQRKLIKEVNKEGKTVWFSDLTKETYEHWLDGWMAEEAAEVAEKIEREMGDIPKAKKSLREIAERVKSRVKFADIAFMINHLGDIPKEDGKDGISVLEKAYRTELIKRLKEIKYGEGMPKLEGKSQTQKFRDGISVGMTKKGVTDVTDHQQHLGALVAWSGDSGYDKVKGARWGDKEGEHYAAELFKAGHELRKTELGYKSPLYRTDYQLEATAKAHGLAIDLEEGHSLSVLIEKIPLGTGTDYEGSRKGGVSSTAEWHQDFADWRKEKKGTPDESGFTTAVTYPADLRGVNATNISEISMYGQEKEVLLTPEPKLGRREYEGRGNLRLTIPGGWISTKQGARETFKSMAEELTTKIQNKLLCSFPKSTIETLLNNNIDAIKSILEKQLEIHLEKQLEIHQKNTNKEKALDALFVMIPINVGS